MAAAGVIMSGNIRGAVEAQKKMGRLKGDFDKAAERAVGLAGQAVKAKAQENLSGTILGVKTGHLRGSVGSVVDKAGMDSSATVGTPVGYGAVHELGSRINKAVKWLERSARDSVQTVRAIFTSQIKAVK